VLKSRQYRDFRPSQLDPGLGSLKERVYFRRSPLVGWLVGFSINVYMSLRLCKTGS
jgi:hypothetical protein